MLALENLVISLNLLWFHTSWNNNYTLCSLPIYQTVHFFFGSIDYSYLIGELLILFICRHCNAGYFNFYAHKNLHSNLHYWEMHKWKWKCLSSNEWWIFETSYKPGNLLFFEKNSKILIEVHVTQVLDLSILKFLVVLLRILLPK